MIRLTLAQMRRSVGRLTAAGVAIAVAAAFVAASLLAGGVFRETTYRAVTAGMADADVVVHPADGRLTPDTVADVAALDAVTAVGGVAEVYGQVLVGGQRAGVVLVPVPPDPALDPYTLTAGDRPADGTGIALTDDAAERLGAEVGDTVRVEWERWDASAGTPDAAGAAPAPADGDAPAAAETSGGWVTETADLTLTGIVTAPSALVSGGATALVSQDNLDAWAAAAEPDGQVAYSALHAVAAAGTSPETAAEQVRDALPGDVLVRTATEEAEAQTADLTGNDQMLTYLALGFAAVAMVVAALVIANTFQVLVAQRTHTLALLRCVGATKAQVRRSVLVEAGLLGLAASAVGLLGGLGLGQLALLVLGRSDAGALPTAISLTPAVVVVPLLTGTVVTVLAALAPARAATRVRPVAALRPATPAGGRAGGRGRWWLALLTTLAGAALLGGAVAGVLLADLDMGLALAVGILGGIVSLTGVLVGAVFLVPGTVRAAGRLLAVVLPRRHRLTARLATVDATRQPRRTSATASALVIGVALVVMMSTAAATARSSLSAELDRQFPVDLLVSSASHDGAGTAALTPAQLAALSGTAGVRSVAELAEADVEVRADGASLTTTVQGLDPAAAERVLRDPAPVAALADDVLLVGPDAAEALGLPDGAGGGSGGGRDADGGADGAGDGGSGAEVTLAGDGGSVTVRARVAEVGAAQVLTTPATLADVEPDARTTTAWAQLTGDDAAATVAAVQDAVAAATTADAAVPQVVGAAAEREAFASTIDTLLAVVVGLLAVAVVIALIGVANTLSLSVIERRREHAVLRAMGLTRGQLRGMLAAEGAEVAVVGAALGAGPGLLYGWAGAAVLLGGLGELQLAVPWPHLAAVLAVALAAGLVASVLPARSATRVPPVAALAAE